VSIVDTATNAVTGLVTDLTPPTFDEPNTISIILMVNMAMC